MNAAYNLSESFFDGTYVNFRGYIDGAMRGLLTDRAGVVDRSVSEELTNFLFR